MAGAATSAPQPSQNGQERAGRDAKEIMLAIKGKTVTWVKDPWFQTVAISTSSGAIVLGGVGGTFGTASGVVIGTTAGALPALFTFGLSLPVGAVAGGSVGLCTGAALGGSAGALCGGAAGHGAYKYRVEIKDGLIYVRSQTVSSAEKAKLTILDTANGIKAHVNTTSLKAKDSAVALTLAAKGKMAAYIAKARATSVATVCDRRVQISAASAAGGAAVCAPVGGAVGACSGIVAGGVIGLPAAIFTFGLSVPFCAAIGAGVGLCTGTATGAGVGAAGAGSVAFGGYTYRKEIGEKTDKMQKKIAGSANLAKLKAAKSATFVRESLNAAFSGTGGTA